MTDLGQNCDKPNEPFEVQRVLRLQSIVIVGGGMAGWLCAAGLVTAFGPNVRITVVEPHQRDHSGVAEATLGTAPQFIRRMGLAGTDWLNRCEGSYTLGIMYENWSRNGSRLCCPVAQLGGPQTSFSPGWSRSGGHPDFVDENSDATDRWRKHRRSTHGPASRLPTTDLAIGVNQVYGYQFDGDRFAEVLAESTFHRGVLMVRDDVVHVHQDGRGWITEILTRRHGSLRGDLYIDCSGPQGGLISKTIGEPFESFGDALPNNRAVALRVPRHEGTRLHSYTVATSMHAGWMRTISLQEHNDYVYHYSDEHTTADVAERMLRELVTPGDQGTGTVYHSQLRAGRVRHSWVRNCVAIGTAGAYVEPLETPAISFIQYAIEQLVAHFPDPVYDVQLVASYNRHIARAVEECRDSLVRRYRGGALGHHVLEGAKEHGRL